MTEELLPCPFCGTEPVIMGDGVAPSYGTTIQCINDDCDIVHMFVENKEGTGGTRPVAIAKWNTRFGGSRHVELKPIDDWEDPPRLR